VVAKDAGKGPRRGEGSGMGYGGGGKMGPSYGESQHVYRKALAYEAQPRSIDRYSELLGSMAMPSSLIGRSRVFINKKGVPVYQSHYTGPAFVRS